MKSIDQLTKQDIADIKILCFDCDGVTIEEGTYIQEADNKLIIKTKSLSDNITNKLERLKKNFFLVFSSGRSLLYLTRMYEKILWDQVALQAESGIFTLYKGAVYQQNSFNQSFLDKSTKIKREIRQISKTNKNILGFEPKQFLVTVHCQQEDKTIEEIVKKNDPENEYSCLWSGEAYDISPKMFNKGSGLEFLAAKMGLKMSNILAVGNDPNDVEMVEKSGIGVITNQETLISHAKFFTSQKQEAGGKELIDKLIELTNE